MGENYKHVYRLQRRNCKKEKVAAMQEKYEERWIKA